MVVGHAHQESGDGLGKLVGVFGALGEMHLLDAGEFRRLFGRFLHVLAGDKDVNGLAERGGGGHRLCRSLHSASSR